MRFHLLFEQSGIFKNVLINKGFNAYDYDILNDYNQTDYQIDLFQEIENEYSNIILSSNYKTIFTDLMPDNDFIIAFFPCTHFCDANQLQYKLWNAGRKLPFDKNNCSRLIERNKNRARYFELYLKFCFICTYKGIKTIIENPASSGNCNYLTQFSPIEVGWYEKDRSLFGDNYKKPTNYFSINFKMEENFVFFSKNIYIKNIYKDAFGMSERSLITKEYVENFFSRFLENKV